MTRIAVETSAAAVADPVTIQTITRMAKALDTGLDQNAIEAILVLLDNGIHPDALAALILELRK